MRTVLLAIRHQASDMIGLLKEALPPKEVEGEEAAKIYVQWRDAREICEFEFDKDPSHINRKVIKARYWPQLLVAASFVHRLDIYIESEK